MKKTLITVLLVAIASAGQAQISDSLAQLFRAKFMAARINSRNFVGAMFAAIPQTITVENELTRRALKSYNQPDTTAIRLLTTEVVTKFLDQELMNTECNEEMTMNKQLLDFYGMAMCKCLTSKAEGQTDGITAAIKNMEVCRDEINSDPAMVTKIRGMFSDTDNLRQVSYCLTPYLHIKCPLLRDELLRICNHYTHERFQVLSDNQLHIIIESFIDIMLNQPDARLASACPDKTMNQYIKSSLGIPAKRLAALHATRDELTFLQELNGANLLLTFVYAGKKSEVLCQVEFGIRKEDYHAVITKFIFTPAAKVKNKQLYLDDAGNPPPMKNLDGK